MSRRDFFARVARIERASGRRVGTASPDDPVRFVASAGLGFASDEARVADGAIETAFLALSGADGALPGWLREEIAREEPEHAPRRALLAPFHHRAVSLLHRSVHRCRVAEESASLDDAWPVRLASLVGAPAGDRLAREVSLLLAPLRFGRPSARGLAQALARVSERWLDGAPVAIEERVGGRVALPDEARLRLGRGVTLGDTAVLGASVADPCARARVVVGPVPGVVAARLAPRADATRALALAVCWLAGDAIEVEIVIEHAATPRAVLGATRGGAALSRTTLGPARARRRERVRTDATPPAPARQA